MKIYQISDRQEERRVNAFNMSLQTLPRCPDRASAIGLPRKFTNNRRFCKFPQENVRPASAYSCGFLWINGNYSCGFLWKYADYSCRFLWGRGDCSCGFLW